MEITNGKLGLLAGLTTLLALSALVLTLARSDNNPFSGLFGAQPDFSSRTPSVKRTPNPQVKIKAAPITVILDPSMTSQSARLTCGVYRIELPFFKGQVYFPDAPAENCEAKLSDSNVGYKPLFGGDKVTCFVEEGHTRCTGGLASTFPSFVSINAKSGGSVYIDGDWYGKLPVSSLRVRPGQHQLEIKAENLPTLRWKLVVKPGEQIAMSFPSPL